jgi:metal-responsive CopG/Arc/MetJ family transcriptional regulator
VLSDLNDDDYDGVRPSPDKWARMNLTIRPFNLERLDALVQSYPFRSRSEAVEMALELLFEKCKTVGDGQ